MASFSSGRPAGRRVAVVLRVAAGRDRGLDDVVRRGEVGLAGTEADDRLAGRLERLGLGVDRQGGGLGDGGDTVVRLGCSMEFAPGRRPAAIVAVDERALFPDIPHPGRPAARRRPLRLRAVEGAARGGRRRSPPTPASTSAPATARARCGSWSSRLRNGLAELFALPDGYEVLLGNGGTTVFWDAATFGLIERRSQHLVLRRVLVEVRRSGAARRRSSTTPRSIEAEPGTAPAGRRADERRPLRPHPQRDLDRRGHAPIAGPDGADDGALVAVDATSAPAGCASTPPRSTSTTSPRRSASPPTAACGSAACSPAAIERIERIRPSDRWIPASLDLGDRPRQLPQGPDLQHARRWRRLPRRPADRVDQRQRRARVGGVPLRPVGRDPSTAGPRRRTSPRRSSPNPPQRSHVVATIDLDDRVDAATVSAVLRANGIVDTESLPQARPQPAAHRAVPGHRARRRRRPHPLHRPRGRRPGLIRGAVDRDRSRPGPCTGSIDDGRSSLRRGADRGRARRRGHRGPRSRRLRGCGGAGRAGGRDRLRCRAPAARRSPHDGRALPGRDARVGSGLPGAAARGTPSARRPRRDGSGGRPRGRVRPSVRRQRVAGTGPAGARGGGTVRRVGVSRAGRRGLRAGRRRGPAGQHRAGVGAGRGGR